MVRSPFFHQGSSGFSTRGRRGPHPFQILAPCVTESRPVSTTSVSKDPVKEYVSSLPHPSPTSFHVRQREKSGPCRSFSLFVRSRSRRPLYFGRLSFSPRTSRNVSTILLSLITYRYPDPSHSPVSSLSSPLFLLPLYRGQRTRHPQRVRIPLRKDEKKF